MSMKTVLWDVTHLVHILSTLMTDKHFNAELFKIST
jgi:hypothetical protein